MRHLSKMSEDLQKAVIDRDEQEPIFPVEEEIEEEETPQNEMLSQS